MKPANLSMSLKTSIPVCRDRDSSCRSGGHFWHSGSRPVRSGRLVGDAHLHVIGLAGETRRDCSGAFHPSARWLPSLPFRFPSRRWCVGVDDVSALRLCQAAPDVINAGHTIAVRESERQRRHHRALRVEGADSPLCSPAGYNVEMGVTNEPSRTERDETPECQKVATPNDTRIRSDRLGSMSQRHRQVRRLHALPSHPLALTDTPAGPPRFSGKKLSLTSLCALHTRRSDGNTRWRRSADQDGQPLLGFALHDMGAVWHVRQGRPTGDSFAPRPCGSATRLFPARRPHAIDPGIRSRGPDRKGTSSCEVHGLPQIKAVAEFSEFPLAPRIVIADRVLPGDGTRVSVFARIYIEAAADAAAPRDHLPRPTFPWRGGEPVFIH